MRIGVSSSCFYPELTEISFEKLGKGGVDTAEIFFNAHCELEKGFVKRLKAIQDEYGINVISIHPTMSLADSFMFFSDYNRRYFEGIEEYKRYAEICGEMGAEYIIMHGGKPNNVLDNRGYFERFAGVADVVRKGGATLLQENVVKFRAGNLKTLKEMKEYLGSVASFCIDIKQSIRGGYSPFEAVKLLGNSVKHIHISDNSSENDCLLPYDGTFDFKNFLCTAHENGFCGDGIIEVYNNALSRDEALFESYRKLKENIL